MLTNSLVSSLKKSSIIPDVLDPFIPTCYILPSYPPSPSSSSLKKVKLGNKLLPSQTQSAPSIQVFCPGKHHVQGGLTIILTDPDAPSRDDDSMSEMCHWIARIPEAVIGKEGVSGEWSGSELEKVGVVDCEFPFLYYYFAFSCREDRCKGKDELEGEEKRRLTRRNR